MSDEISAGDVVVLKSGSLPMTVSHVGLMNGVLNAWVIWSDAKHAQHKATYPVAALKKTS